MIAGAVASRLNDAGLAVTADASGVVVKPTVRLIPEMVERAHRHKREILALIAFDESATANPGAIPPRLCLTFYRQVGLTGTKDAS